MSSAIVRTLVEPEYWPRPFSAKRDPDVLSIHRLGPGLNGVKLRSVDDALAWFAQREAGTGCKFPYHVVAWPGFDGLARVEQTLPFDVRGAAQRRWNYRSIGIAVVGDWRQQSMSPHAARDLVDVCASLCDTLNLRYLDGHSGLKNSSQYAGHRCPGQGINLDCLRRLTGTLNP